MHLPKLGANCPGPWAAALLLLLLLSLFVPEAHRPFVTRPHVEFDPGRVAGEATSGSLAKRSPDPAFVDLRQPSPIFAMKPLGAYLEAMSADILLTLNARAGAVVTHEPGFDLRFLLVAGAGFEPATSGL